MIDPDKKVEEPVAMNHAFGFKLKLYPVTCPCCGTKVPVTQKMYPPQIYAIGSTKASLTGKRKKTEKASKVTIQEQENY